MKFDGYDLTVLVDGHVLPEVQHHHKTIVVAKPGSEFAVRVARGLQAGSINGEVQVVLEVDGRHVGYTYRISRGQSTTFEGFAIPGCAQDVFRYQAFKFAAADSSSDPSTRTVTHPDQIKHGKLSIKCYNVVPSNRKPGSKTHGADKPSGPSAKLPEGKKWFLAPSLTTQAGTVKTTSRSWGKVVYDRVGPAFLELELHYKTASTLLLRKVLDADKPEHRAILQEYGDETARALVKPEPQRASRASRPAGAAAAGAAAASRARSSAAPAESVASAAGAPARRKRSAAAAGVKQEEQAAGSKRARQPAQQSSGAIVVDLTGPAVMPATRVAGREVQRNEVALCDLTGEVPGTSRNAWKVEKKPVYTIT